MLWRVVARFTTGEIVVRWAEAECGPEAGSLVGDMLREQFSARASHGPITMRPTPELRHHSGVPIPDIRGTLASSLDLAILYATAKHAGQIDEDDGAPHIFHCLRVMERVREHGPLHMQVAVLHDVIEDTTTEPINLSTMFGVNVTAAVLSVTRRGLLHGEEKERYKDFIERAATDPVGRTVKIADVIDNLERCRKSESKKWRGMARRYEHALNVLCA